MLTKQNPEESPSPEALAEMDKRNQELREEASNLNATAKSLRSTLSSLNSTLSTADLRTAITEMDAERTEILDRLTSLRTGAAQPVSKEEKEEVDKQAKMWEKIVMRRKRIVKEMWSSILDSVPDAAKVAELKVIFIIMRHAP
jgi:26S proteasome regulatory subunit (ATPase 3-interacting protein)